MSNDSEIDNRPSGRDGSRAARTHSASKLTPSTIRSRIILIVILLSSTCFFDGCENQDMRLTVGTPPIARFGYDDVGWAGRYELLEFWPIGLLINVLVFGIGVTWVLASGHKTAVAIRHQLSKTSVWVATIITVAVFNSFLYLPSVWIYCVFFPLAQLPIFDEPVNYGAVRVITRLYWLLWVFGLSVLFAGIGWVYRKQFMVEEGRWWQVSLGGLMAAMVILGTAFGIIGRILMAPGE